MKKKFVLILTAILAAGTIFASSVFAASGPVLTASDANASVGETVTITVSLSNNPGINWNSFYVDYDSSKLQLVGAQNGSVLNSWDSYSVTQADGTYLVTAHTSSTKNTSKDGTVAVLTFKVLAGASGSDCTVSLTPKECYTSTGSSVADVNVTAYSGMITVSGSKPSGNTDTDSKPSDDQPSSEDKEDTSSDGTTTDTKDDSASSSGSSSQNTGSQTSTDTTKPASGNNDSKGPAAQDGWYKNGDTWFYSLSGKDVTGWQKIGGTWYYFSFRGEMLTGWQKVDGVWYYLKPSGAMATGWQKVDGAWYYLTGSGAMKTGWVQTGGKWYYLSGSGAMKTGWVQSSGKWYYLGADGAMLTNTITPDGFKVNGDGVWEQ